MCDRLMQGAAGAGGAGCGREAADCGGGCGAVSGCAWGAAAAGIADGISDRRCRMRCWMWCGGMRGRMGRSRRSRWRSGLGLPVESVEAVLQRLVQAGRVQEGGFRPGGVHREWCEVEVLRPIRRKSAGAVAQGGRAGGAADAGAAVYAMAGCGAAAAGAGCAAGCD